MDGSTLNSHTTARDHSPDRRYRQARRAAAAGRLLLAPAADPTTRQLSRLLARQKYCRSEEERRQIERSPLGKMFAEVIDLSRDATRDVVGVVEAPVLADVPSSEIADRMQISIATAQLYEHLFFDVRRALANRTYIYDQAIWPELRRGPVETARHRFVVRLLAYNCGVAPLDDLYPQVVDTRHAWERPIEFFERLNAERELDAFADLAISDDDTRRLSPARLREIAATVRECLVTRCQKAYPSLRPSATLQERLAQWKRQLKV